MKTDTESRNKDFDFIQKPDSWPRWPVLPMKSRDATKWATEEFCGIILAGEPTKVYLTNVFALSDANKGAENKTWKEVLAGVKAKEYASIDEMLAEYTVD